MLKLFANNIGSAIALSADTLLAAGSETATEGVLVFDISEHGLVDFPENNLPTANAGSDQSVVDSDNNGNETVTLDGSASTDSDGTISSYEWTWNDGSPRSAIGISPQASFPIGTTTVTLHVTDNEGATDTDTVEVTITLPAPDAPLNLSAISTGSTEIDLSWTDNSNNETGFKVQQSATSGGPWTDIGTSGANTSTYVVYWVGQE